MTSFHDNIRSVLTDVEKFLVETLKKINLPKAAKEHKQHILDKVAFLREEYPALLPGDQQDSSKPEAGRDESAGTSGSSNADDAEDGIAEDIPLKSVADLKDPEFSGFLEKKQKKSKSMLLGKAYQKRWCIIKDKIFYYYENKKDKKQNGAFSLEGYELKPAPDLVKDSSKKPLSFELVCTDKRSFQFIAATKDDYIGWQTAVETAQGLIEEDIYDVVGEKEIGVVDDSYEITDDADESSQSSSSKPDEMPSKSKKPLPSTPATNSRDVSNGSLSEKSIPEETYEIPDSDEPRPPSPSTMPSLPVRPPPIKKAAGANKQKAVDETQEIYDDAITEEKQELYDDAITNKDPNAPEELYEDLDDYATNDKSSLQEKAEGKMDTPPSRPPSPPPPIIKKHGVIPGRRPPPSIPLPSTPPKTPSKETTVKAVENVPKIRKAEEDFENMFYGRWSCTGDKENELSFKQGDIIHIINRDLDAQSWWVGELNGSFGLVPKTYLTPAYEEVAA